MSVHVLLVDGLNLIRRIFAAQARPYPDVDNITPSTSQQLMHNTQSQCEQAMRKLLSEHTPTHALVVFDAPLNAPNWRHQKFSGYKQGRTPMPAILAQGLEALQEGFWRLGVDSIVPEQDEADDVIATLAQKVAGHQGTVSIVSTDKGYGQLLCGRIRQYDYFKRSWVSAAQIQEKFGVQPHQLSQYWALAGDSTNKIPGLKGIGPKRAAELLTTYGTLESLLASTSLARNLQNQLKDEKDTLVLYQELCTLRTNIPLGFNLKDIRFPQKQG